MFSKLRCMSTIVASKRSFIGFSVALIATALITNKSARITTGYISAGTEAGCMGICDPVTRGRGTVTARVADAADAEKAPSGEGFFGTLLFGEPATIGSACVGRKHNWTVANPTMFYVATRFDLSFVYGGNASQICRCGFRQGGFDVRQAPHRCGGMGICPEERTGGHQELVEIASKRGLSGCAPTDAHRSSQRWVASHRFAPVSAITKLLRSNGLDGIFFRQFIESDKIVQPTGRPDAGRRSTEYLHWSSAISLRESLRRGSLRNWFGIRVKACDFKSIIALWQPQKR